MRERDLQRRSAAEASERQEPGARREPVPAAILALQRSAGNAATAALLQRTRQHADRYAPDPGQAIAPQFKTNHIGTDEWNAIDQHANRGTFTGINTFVAMTGEDAANEIYDYLEDLAATANVTAWDRIEFVTYNGYPCYQTELLDNTTGLYRVRKVVARIRVTAWWKEALGAFVLGHMGGIVDEIGPATVTRVQAAPTY